MWNPKRRRSSSLAMGNQKISAIAADLPGTTSADPDDEVAVAG